MQGNSGPYMQYTYVRCSSVLKDQQIGKVNKVNELNLEETILLRIIQKFPEVVINAAETYSPNIITTYLFDLAQNFNLFYQKHSILKAEDEIKDFRIALTAATAQVIKNGLHLLGIETVEKM
jgi:arginyl-tRNA synthetase